MENDAMPGAGSPKQGPIKGQPKYKNTEPNKDVHVNFARTITFSGQEWTITGTTNHKDNPTVHYYDLKQIGFISNTGLAKLILLLKSLLKEGVEVQFINVNEKIKRKIKEMGLDHVLNCR